MHAWTASQLYPPSTLPSTFEFTKRKRWTDLLLIAKPTKATTPSPRPDAGRQTKTVEWISGTIVIKVANWVGRIHSARTDSAGMIPTGAHLSMRTIHEYIAPGVPPSSFHFTDSNIHNHRLSGCRVSPETPNRSDAISINHTIPGTQTRRYRIDTPAQTHTACLPQSRVRAHRSDSPTPDTSSQLHHPEKNRRHASTMLVSSPLRFTVAPGNYRSHPIHRNPT